MASFNQTFAGVLVWVPRTTQVDYVEIDATTPECRASIGRVGGRHILTAGGCGVVGGVLHEMGHSAGLWHTQQDPAGAPFIERTDGDPRYTASSTKFYTGVTSVGGYDFGSIMHYNAVGLVASGDTVKLLTIPRGIDIQQIAGYSTGDIDAIRRLYGAAGSAITIQTNPPGLRVIVDGVEVATPHVVQCVHRVGPSAGRTCRIQTMGPDSFGFGRWSHDRRPNPPSSQLYLVEPGDGTPWQPVTMPKHGVLVANFVRLIKLVPTTPDPALGSWSWSPEARPWPGTSDLYPQTTRVDVMANAAARGTVTELWDLSGGLFISREIGQVARAAVRLYGPATNRLGPVFRAANGVLVRQTDPVDDVVVTFGDAANPMSNSSVLLPVFIRSGNGWSDLKVKPASLITYMGPSAQIEYKGATGLDDPVAGTVAIPTSGVKTVTLNLEKQFQPFVQVNPWCGGSVTLSDSRTWVPAGKPLTADRATPGPGAVFAGWTGTVSGMSANVTDSAAAIPVLIANFNTIPEPLTLASITPDEFVRGNGATRFTLKGSGLTPQSLVTLGSLGSGGTVQYVDSRTINLTLTDADVGPPGVLAVFIQHRIASCVGLVSDAIPLKVRAAGPVSGNATIVSNPYGAIGVQGATLAGTSLSAFAQKSVIQLGSIAGAAGSVAQIDFQGLSVGAGTSLTIRSGAVGQEVFLRDLSSTPTLIAGRLQIEGSNGAPPPRVYLHNPSGVVVFPDGIVQGPSGLTIDTLGSTVLMGGRIVNQGAIDGGTSLTLLTGQAIGGGALRGNTIVLSTFGNANNPANGAHFLSNALQFFPSSGNDVALSVNHYGVAPQIINLKVNGNASLAMPSAWQSSSTLPPNNATVPAGGAVPPGTQPPTFGGGSIIVQSTGNMKLLGGASGDLVFPGGIVLKAAGTLDVNGVLVNQGWTTSGRAFQGVFLESPNIVSASRIQILSNDLNWTNFSTTPHAKVSVSTLVRMPDGSEQYAPADGIVTHINSYSLITEAAANGACWICLLDPTPVTLN